MTDYRGIEKQDVMNSLQAGEAFLRQLGLGSATENEIDTWLLRDPYAKIEAAESREELAKVMAETGSVDVFLRAGDLFYHHACTDTNGEGLKIYQDLAGWGAFSGFMTMELRPSDEEKQAHLVCEYARLIAAQGDTLPAATQQKMDAVIGEFRENNPGRDNDYDYAEQQLQDMILLARDGDLAGVASLYLQSPGHVTYVMETALKAASGVRDNPAPHISPFSQYGIEVPVLPNDPQGLQDVIGPIAEQVEPVLANFRPTDEVTMTMVGLITKEGDKVGYAFRCTKPAAQAVADALPQLKIIDYTGKRLLPSGTEDTAAPQETKKPGGKRFKL